MVVNVRDSDKKNEIKVLSFLQANFPPFFNLTATPQEDKLALFDIHLFSDSDHYISLEVKGCGKAYEEINQFSEEKYHTWKDNPSIEHFIAYNYLDGRIKLHHLNSCEVALTTGEQWHTREKKYKIQTTAWILSNSPKWDFKGDEFTKYIPLSLL